MALSQQLARIRKEVTLADGEGDAAVADLVCARGDGRGDPHCIQADVFDLGQTRGDDADPVCTRGDDADPVCTRGDDADPVCTRGDDADPVCTRGDDADPVCIRGDVADPVCIRGDDADPVCIRGDDAPPCSDMQKPHDVFPTDTSGVLHMTTDWSSREELFH